MKQSKLSDLWLLNFTFYLLFLRALVCECLLFWSTCSVSESVILILSRILFNLFFLLLTLKEKKKNKTKTNKKKSPPVPPPKTPTKNLCFHNSLVIPYVMCYVLLWMWIHDLVLIYIHSFIVYFVPQSLHSLIVQSSYGYHSSFKTLLFDLQSRTPLVTNN